MHEGSQSGLSHGIRICQWSCCGSQREYCSSCCCQYRACSTSPVRGQKFLHSILNCAVPGGVGSNKNSTIRWAPADPPCTVCADRVSTRQNCSVQQKAIAHNAVIVLLRGFHNVPAAIRRGPALCWRKLLQVIKQICGLRFCKIRIFRCRFTQAFGQGIVPRSRTQQPL